MWFIKEIKMDREKIENIRKEAFELALRSTDKESMYFIGLAILELAEAIENAQEVKEKGEQK